MSRQERDSLRWLKGGDRGQRLLTRGRGVHRMEGGMKGVVRLASRDALIIPGLERQGGHVTGTW